MRTHKLTIKRLLSIYFRCALIVIVLVFVAFRFLPISTVHRYFALIGTIIVVCAVIGLGVGLWYKGRASKLLTGLFYISLWGLFMTAVLLSGNDLYILIKPSLTPPELAAENRICITAICLFIGIGLYTLKRRHKLIYGLLEIGAALFANWKLLGAFVPEGREQLNLTLGIGLIGTLYFLSRGVGNMIEGMEEHAESRSKQQMPSGPTIDKTEEEGY